MAGNMSQATLYREMVRLEFRNYRTPPDSDPDMAFRAYLEYQYEETKDRLNNLLDSCTSESAIKVERSGLFVISAGLLTFGRLDVAQDILDGIPGGRGSVNQLVRVVNALLPIPKDLDALANPAAVMEWVQVKQSKLRWDESLERYILSNFIVLPGVPTSSKLEQFSVTDNEIYQEGLVVEVQPDTGHSWLGNFQPGQSELSGVYQHPNRIDMIVISKGQGYIINPESRQLVETFGGSIFGVTDLPELYFILFQSASSLLGCGSSGFLWQNPKISWDSIRVLKVQGNILIGEFHRLKDNFWISFCLNIKTGEVQLGEYSLPKPTHFWWQFL